MGPWAEQVLNVAISYQTFKKMLEGGNGGFGHKLLSFLFHYAHKNLSTSDHASGFQITHEDDLVTNH